jgi:hypothetical protein
VLGCPICPAVRAVVSARQFWRWEGREKKTYGGSVSKRDETKEREKKINGRDLTQTKGMKRKTEREENFTLHSQFFRVTEGSG